MYTHNSIIILNKNINNNVTNIMTYRFDERTREVFTFNFTHTNDHLQQTHRSRAAMARLEIAYILPLK